MRKLNIFAGISAGSIALTMLVILSELSEPFKNLITSIFWHHWIGKLIITTAIFFIVGFSVQKETIAGRSADKVAYRITIFALAIVLVFFIIGYFI